MDIQPYIDLDRQSLLEWNGSDSLFWDGFMWVATSTYIWIPLGIVLLYVLFKNNRIENFILLVVMLALVITLADQIASGICKPFFQRFRPTQDSEIMYLVDIVNGYRGGRYGFFSSHASNTFAIAIFISLLIQNGLLSFMLIFWAIINSYSRIYLGVHFPGDILFGTLTGCMVGGSAYWGYLYLQKHYFKQPKCISNQYTSGNYLITDVHLLETTFLLTLFAIIIWGMITAKIQYL